MISLRWVLRLLCRRCRGWATLSEAEPQGQARREAQELICGTDHGRGADPVVTGSAGEYRMEVPFDLPTVCGPDSYFVAVVVPEGRAGRLRPAPGR